MHESSVWCDVRIAVVGVGSQRCTRVDVRFVSLLLVSWIVFLWLFAGLFAMFCNAFQNRPGMVSALRD